MSLRPFSPRLQLALALVVVPAALVPVSGVELGIAGAAFTLDGRPTFLLGASYYGALGAPEEFIRRDLDDLQRHGFNWIRVWATWSAFTNDVSAVDTEGRAREPFLSRLTWLVAESDRRGLVVDVTLSRGNGVTGPPRLATLAAHQRAVETLVRALASHRNWYLDLGNERNIRDARFVRVEELRQLREAVKRLDPRRLVTASHAGGDLTPEVVRQYALEAKLDFLAPHRPREPGSPAQTAAHTRAVLGWLNELGQPMPVHYQEPFRRGYGAWQPAAADFLTDLQGARDGGAAGWCFHNGDDRHAADGEPRRSFDLRARRLFDQWDAEERAFLAGLRPASARADTAPGSGPWPPTRPAVGSPLPASLPRAGTNPAEMLPGQRTLGSREVPDNQTDHDGSYSWLWGVNGVGRDGIRGVVVMPELELVASWNDGQTDTPARENEAFRRLATAVRQHD